MADIAGLTPFPCSVHSLFSERGYQLLSFVEPNEPQYYLLPPQNLIIGNGKFVAMVTAIKIMLVLWIQIS